MLLLGKSLENLENILNNGFQNSVYWDFEPGLYITDSLNMAIHYSETKYQKKKRKRYVQDDCIFVNEVLNSKQLQTECFDKFSVFRKFENPFNYSFAKYEMSPRSTKKESRATRKEDFTDELQ